MRRLSSVSVCLCALVASLIRSAALVQHGKKGFVILTKSFVKIGITKTFCYNKMLSSVNKTFGCCSKIFGCSNKNFICCPLFCCRNKTIFSVNRCQHLPPYSLRTFNPENRFRISSKGNIKKCVKLRTSNIHKT